MAIRNLTKFLTVVLAILTASFVGVFGFNFDNFDAEIEAIDNPFTGDIDYIRNGNFSGSGIEIGETNVTGNINVNSNNLTDVDCILFISGGQICDSP